MLQHVRIQHPVGQGFFHSAFIQVGGARFTYVYDCGSEQVDALSNEIQGFSEHLGSTGDLDAVFISHLDSDHVNGLDRLLACVNARIAILPYLQPFERIMLIARAVEANTLTGSMLSIAIDPLRWFGDRGVRTVIFSRGYEEEEGEVPPVTPPEPTLSDSFAEFRSDRLSLELDVNAIREEGEVSEQPGTATGERIEQISVSHNVPLGLRIGRHRINWALITFVHPEHERVKAFEEAVRRAFPKCPLDGKHWTSDTTKWLLDVVKNHAERARLAACYAFIRGDRNLTSMSLYSGPASLHERYAVQACSIYWLTSLHNIPNCGWLGTGDSNMAAPMRREALLSHLGYLVKGVRTVTAPHHGSRRSIDAEFIDKVGSVYVASAGANSRHRHPHPEVVAMILSKRLDFIHTTEEPGSAYIEHITQSSTNRTH